MALPADLFYDDEDVADSPPLTPAMIAAAEQQLGYRLPGAYVRLLVERNGGPLRKHTYVINDPTIYPYPTVLVGDLMGIGGQRGIDSALGSAYLIAEWGYPALGIVIATEGHTAVMLDYRACGPHGEPQVVFVDTELEPEPYVCLLAADFSSFISGLREEGDAVSVHADFAPRTDYAHTLLTDDDLERLFGRSQNTALWLISELRLAGTQVTDAGLPHLHSLRHLRRLDLSGTQVSNAGVATLASLPLSSLAVAGTSVILDAEGLKLVKQLSSLVRIVVNEAQIASGIVDQLARDWPGLEVVIVP